MQKNQKQKGRLIVFEGIDGSGKSTQTNLLIEYLKKGGWQTEKLDFPRHGETAGIFVDNYLLGKYGTAEEVGPYRASIFYACDRYDASFKIKEWLGGNKIVVLDRYVTSNIGHQGGKISSKKERSKFFKWIFNLEFKLFAIPVPDITVLLKTGAEISLKLSGTTADKEKQTRLKSYLGKEKKDIHEKDRGHLKNALDSYLQAAKEFPDYFKVIDCVQNNKLLAPEIIHQKVVKAIRKIL
ncbi:MAG: thymidylate kinase [Patescibacteria group bacterium]|nr:thymidylate kinase [Patescibacteria group bacterium]